jgi:hypothetical protein
LVGLKLDKINQLLAQKIEAMEQIRKNLEIIADSFKSEIAKRTTEPK